MVQCKGKRTNDYVVKLSAFIIVLEQKHNELVIKKRGKTFSPIRQCDIFSSFNVLEMYLVVRFCMTKFDCSLHL